MKRLFIAIVIHLCVLFSIYAQTTDASILKEIQNLIQKNHPNPYTKVSKSKFESSIAKLEKTWNKKSENEKYFQMRKLVASIGDGHTLILKNSIIDDEFLPFFILPYGKHSIIVQVESEYSELAGKELIAINGITTENILKRFFPYLSFDKYGWGHLQARYECLLASSLRYIKVLKEDKNFSIKYRNAQDGSVKTLNLALSESPQLKAPVFANLSPTLFQSGYYRALNLQDILFIQYNICENNPDMPMSDFALRIEQIATSFKKIVVDLRHNAGGNSEVIKPLLNILNHLKNEGIPLFVIVGPGTFSSGVMVANDLKEIGATIIGEEVGWNGKFGEVKSFELSGNTYTLFCSTKDFSEIKGLTSLQPDVMIDIDAKNLQHAIDDAVEYIKKQ